MKQAHNITPIHDCNKLSNSSEYNSYDTVTMSKDQWLGECLDDYLFKLCGTDQVVWIPKNKLRPSPFDHHAFEASISFDEMYCCARLTISNSIRMCLVGQHQVKGSQLLPYLIESSANSHL